MSLASNKKAYHDYEILSETEAGIALAGTEVKSVKGGKMNLKESFVRIVSGEAFLINCHISPYEKGNIFNRDPLRQRKLLLHKKEIEQLRAKVQEKGLGLTVTKAYMKGRRIKVSLALVRGKKLHDKRRSLKEKAVNREMEREFKIKN